MWMRKLWSDVMWLFIVVGALAMASFGSWLPHNDFEDSQVVRSPTGNVDTQPIQVGP